MKIKAIYNSLEPPKEFVLPEDFEGFDPERIRQIREIRKGQAVETGMCLLRDSEQLKSVLRYRLKKLGFIADNNQLKSGAYTHIFKKTGIRSEMLMIYLNHNRHIRNQANGKHMQYISQTHLLILCLFVGIKIRLDIDPEPLELIQ